jgi:hypothetical protein
MPRPRRREKDNAAAALSSVPKISALSPPRQPTESPPKNAIVIDESIATRVVKGAGIVIGVVVVIVIVVVVVVVGRRPGVRGDQHSHGVCHALRRAQHHTECNAAARRKRCCLSALAAGSVAAAASAAARRGWCRDGCAQ